MLSWGTLFSALRLGGAGSFFTSENVEEDRWPCDCPIKTRRICKVSKKYPWARFHFTSGTKFLPPFHTGLLLRLGLGISCWSQGITVSHMWFFTVQSWLYDLQLPLCKGTMSSWLRATHLRRSTRPILSKEHWKKHESPAKVIAVVFLLLDIWAGNTTCNH